MFSLTSSQKLFGEKAFLALTWNGGRGTVSEMREAAARLRGGSSGIKASADFRNPNSLLGENKSKLNFLHQHIWATVEWNGKRFIVASVIIGRFPGPRSPKKALISTLLLGSMYFWSWLIQLNRGYKYNENIACTGISILYPYLETGGSTWKMEKIRCNYFSILGL